MAYQRSYTVSTTTDVSGDATAYSEVARGRVVAIVTDVDALDATADTTITTEDTALAVTTLTNTNTNGTIYPRPQVHDLAGAAIASSYDSAGVPVSEERIKVVIAQGGATKAASFKFIVE